MTKYEQNMTPIQKRAHERAMLERDVRAHSTADVVLELTEHVGGKKAADMIARPNDVGKERYV